jgi:WD40 repeat protein
MYSREINNDEFGRRLKKILIDIGMRQQKLVEITQISQPRLSRIMNGLTPSNEELRKLLQVQDIKTRFDKAMEESAPQSSIIQQIARQSPLIKTYPISQSRLTACGWTQADNRMIAGGFDGRLYWIDAGDEIAQSVKVSNAILRAMCAYREFVIVVDDAGNIFSVLLSNPEVKLVGHTNSPVYACALSRKASRLLTAERSGDVTEWDLENIGALKGEQIKKIRVLRKHEGAAFDVAYSDGADIYRSVGADGYLRSTSGSFKANRDYKVSSATLFSFSVARGRAIVACSSASGDIHLLEEDQEEPSVLKGHADAVRSLEFSPGEKWLISGSKDGSVRLWNIESHNAWILMNAADYVYTVKFSSTGDRVLVSDGTGKLHIITFAVSIDDIGQDQVDSLLAKDVS